jgi:hypothetical protein
MQQNFAPIEQNFKNMERGLAWLFKKIYALLGYLAIPLEKLYNFISGESSKGDDWL